MKKVMLAFSLLFMGVWVFGQFEPQAEPGLIVDFGVSQVLGTSGIYNRVSAGGLLSFAPVSVVGSLSVQNDGKFGELVAGFWGGFNGRLNEGGIRVDTSPFSARVGRFFHSDLVDSPYSLFVSSAPITAIQAELRVDIPGLFVVSRWIELNRDSARQFGYPSGYPERGATFKTIGMEFGDLRVAFQDSAVFTGRSC